MINRVISLGAGVQSTAMLLMSDRGELPKVDCAIFADTKREPPHVYENIEWLKSEVRIPIYQVEGYKVDDDDYFLTKMPLYVINQNRDSGIQPRQCTSNFKILPINRYIRHEFSQWKIFKGFPVECWIGFTIDEAQRMKDSRVKYVKNVYPLIDLNMTYSDCQEWLNQNYPEINVRKSACICCPYRRDKMWRELKYSDPDSFQYAIEIDEKVRHLPGDSHVAYIHDKRKPLKEIDLRNEREKGQTFLFNEICEGNCGT